MKMRFKKIYIEITNACNLKCKFCIGNQRKIKYINKEQFKTILKKIKPYTNYIYMHILGEPLMHPEINKLINYAYNEGFKINITTNGYLIEKIKNQTNIRQINISLHAYDKTKINLEKYMTNIFNTIKTLKNTYISLRIWTKTKYTKEILEYIENKYNIKIENIFKNIKLEENIYLNSSEEFIWPDLNNTLYNETGTCYGLIDHIGIHSNGDIVPCCLDTKANIKLGNIYEEEIETILNKEKTKNIIKGFKNNKKCEELCKHCNFIKQK